MTADLDGVGDLPFPSETDKEDNNGEVLVETLDG